MPRQLALLIYVCAIVWLFRSDMKLRRAGSWALLVPGLWLAITGSRPLPYWFGVSASPDATNLEGNPINLLVQGALIVAAVVVMQRRGFRFGTFVSNNKALILIYAYFAATALWSFTPVPSLKRIFKDFGCVFMAMVLLTEPDPFLALRIVFVRVSYVLFPLSVLFIKYYPELGRMYSKGWDLMYTGVTTHKNSLGEVVIVFGLVVVLDLLQLRREVASRESKKALNVRYVILAAGLWLLFMSDSKTSLLCLMVALLILWGTGHLKRMRSQGQVVAACLAVVVCLALLEAAFGISGAVLAALGRNETLTGRTEVWEMIKSQKTNPVFGCGFMSFWDTPMAQAYNERNGTSIVTAHNGYLDVYLDGGTLSVLFLALFLFAGGQRILSGLLDNTLFGRAKAMFFAMVLIYNWSETTFFRLDPLWLMFLTVTINCSHLLPQGLQHRRWKTEPNERVESESLVTVT